MDRLQDPRSDGQFVKEAWTRLMERGVGRPPNHFDKALNH